MLVTKHGPAWMTVTGVTLPSSSKTWLMPTFLPIIPFIQPPKGLLMGASGNDGRKSGPLHHPGSEISCDSVPRRRHWLLNLNLDVHTRGQVQPHQGINRLAIRVKHVDQALVCANLKVLL